MPDFVQPGSIVRKIWGNADVVLFIFAGSAAEFALNRAVDWLFFTGALPRDPIGRLFATARYAQEIVFVDEDTANRVLARIHATHLGVERSREQQIPDWAHRDVLYMLIDYSERAFELLERPLTDEEREELYDVFRRVGEGLRIPGLPTSYSEFRRDRSRHMERDLVYSDLTADLYRRYRTHLGAWRYHLLLQVQGLLVPTYVAGLLGLHAPAWLRLALGAYGILVRLRLRPLVWRSLMPAAYLPDVRRLDYSGPHRVPQN